MPYCDKCGAKNDDDAQYCTKCGNHLANSSSFEKDIDKFAEEFGRKAEQFGKHIEKKAKEFAQSVNQSVDSRKKKCPDCMVDLDGDAKFCWKCGKEIK
jgi:uncharacterized membrane protein YvbJ